MAGFSKFIPFENATSAGDPAKAAKAAKPSAKFSGFSKFSSGRLAFCPSEAESERTVVVEHDTGVPHEWEEGVARLDGAVAPAGFAAHRWRELVDNAGRFIDRWAAQARSLGWTTFSIFGCHPEAPLARHDMQGLVFLIGSGEVVAITAATAAIRTRGGALLTFRRMPLPPGKRPACLWEL